MRYGAACRAMGGRPPMSRQPGSRRRAAGRGTAADQSPSLLAADLRTNEAFFDLLTGSYARLLGTPLLPEACGAAWLYHEAPFAVLAHGNGPDPLFLYANKAAQACFGYSWEEFACLPSRQSAAPSDEPIRQGVSDMVVRKGFVADYSERRLAKSGTFFWIDNGTIWQLIDPHGLVHGQAATFPLAE